MHVDGLRRTKDDVIFETVREVFDSTNFSEVVTNANRVRGRLEALGCFKHVDIFIDTSSAPDASKDGLEVRLAVLGFFSNFFLVGDILCEGAGTVKGVDCCSGR